MKQLLLIILVFLCSKLCAQSTSKIYYEVYRNNSILKFDSIEVKAPTNQSTAFDIQMNNYDIIHLKGGDSLWMYLFYPTQFYKYSSFHNSNFEAPWINIPDPPYNVEQYYTTGGYVIRDKFDDSLSMQDTLLYFLSSSAGTSSNRFFIVQFDDLDNSIGEINKFDFKIYPNPSIGEFNIKLSGFATNEELEYKLYDINGRLVFEYKEFGNVDKKVSLADMRQGIYYLEITIQEKMYRQKLVFQQ